MEKKLQAGQQYKWTPEDIFNLDGKEFSIFYNTLNAYVNSEDFKNKLTEANNTMSLFNLYNLAQSKLEEGLSNGIIKLVTNEVTPSDAVMDSMSNGN